MGQGGKGEKLERKEKMVRNGEKLKCWIETKNRGKPC